MKKYFNYITTLPDFIEMQRVSFCWFLSYGLTNELLNFSSVFDLTANVTPFFLQLRQSSANYRETEVSFRVSGELLH